MLRTCCPLMAESLLTQREELELVLQQVLLPVLVLVLEGCLGPRSLCKEAAATAVA